MQETEVTACADCGLDEPDEDTLHNGRLLCVHCVAQGCPSSCDHVTL